MAKTKKKSQLKSSAYQYPASQTVNLPTAETALFMAEEDRTEVGVPLDDGEEAQPITWPYLTWERDENASEPKAAPLYIHDKISPHEFVQSLITEKPEQSDLFADFDGLPENAVYEWYQHRGNWQNRLIKGTGQQVMASLVYKEGLSGQVDMVYMDPPYNINFKSNFMAQTNDLDVGDNLNETPPDPMTIKTFRDAYARGIHSYLDQLEVQFRLVKTLLKDSGSIFVQIGMDNLHEIALILNSIFGKENHVTTIPIRTGNNPSASMLQRVGNWLIWYTKDKRLAERKYHKLYLNMDREETIAFMSYGGKKLELCDGSVRNLTTKEIKDFRKIPVGSRVFTTYPLYSRGESSTDRSEVFRWDSNGYRPPAGSQWSVSLQGLRSIGDQNRIFVPPNGKLRWKKYEDEMPGRQLNSFWNDVGAPSNKIYAVQTAEKTIERCLLMTTDPGDLVLDPTCGSGTTAYCAEKWGRRWITCDTQPTAIAVTRQRLATATFPYYLLKDSPKGHRKECERNGDEYQEQTSYSSDPSQGFVYEREIDISARSLAYGPSGLNTEPVQYIEHVDRPEIDKSLIRVTSRFSVQSHSPFRSESPEVLNAYQSMENNRRSAQETHDRITAALQSGRIHAHDETWKVTSWQVHPENPIIQYTGTIAFQADGVAEKAAFYVGREDETITALTIRMAAENARMLADTRHLIVIGFNFEGMTNVIAQSQERMGALNVIKCRANLDLMIPELENQEDDRAFVVISEPDVDITAADNDQLTLTVLGLDVYNPKAGQAERTGLREIDCIMVDTDYNGQSFFARRINFPQTRGNREQQLQDMRREFRERIDEAKWEIMRTATTIPFDPPRVGHRIAVKVIDNTGMEHMRVLDVL